MNFIFCLLLCFTAVQAFGQIIEAKSTFEISGTQFRVEYYESDGDNFEIIIYKKVNGNFTTHLTDRVEIFGSPKFSLEDINKDQYLDLVVGFKFYSGRSHLYVYMPGTKSFSVVEGYENYPDAKPITDNSKYYYSYIRRGCDGKVWNSDLFTIKLFSWAISLETVAEVEMIFRSYALKTSKNRKWEFFH